jgi:hypothetical protein
MLIPPIYEVSNLHIFKTERLLSKIVDGVRQSINTLYLKNQWFRVRDGLQTQLRGFTRKVNSIADITLFISLENLLPNYETLYHSDSNTMEMICKLLSSSVFESDDPYFLISSSSHLEKL